MPQSVVTTVKGGNKLAKVLGDLGRRMGNGTVNIGFLSGARYPDTKAAGGKTKPGIPVAQAAFWDEFGTSTSKPRPFMRDTVAQKSPTWGDRMARLAVKTNYNGPLVLKLMGEGIKDQFVTAIKQWPPDNAPRTVDAKGFNKGLIHTGVMQRSVDFEVKGT